MMKRPTMLELLDALAEVQIVVSVRPDALTQAQLDAVETIYRWATVPAFLLRKKDEPTKYGKLGEVRVLDRPAIQVIQIVPRQMAQQFSLVDVEHYEHLFPAFEAIMDETP